MTDGGGRRYRRVAATALVSAAAKGTQFLLLVISVPLALPYLGGERYGAWMALSGAFAVLSAVDLGLPNAAMTTVASASGRDDRDAMRRALGGAGLALTALAMLLAAAMALAWPQVDWRWLLNLQAEAWAVEASGAAAVLATAWLLGLPLAAATRVRHGLQEGWVAAAWDGAGAVLALVGLVAAVAAQASLPVLAAAVAWPPVLAQACHLAHLLRGRPWLRPGRADLDPARLPPLLRMGLSVFVLQAAAAVVAAADPFLVARLFGAESAAGFSVTQRLAILPNLAVGLVLAPLWPAYAEARARGDQAWIQATFRRSQVAAVCLGIASCLVLGIAGPWIVGRWTRGAVVADPGLLWAQGAWLVCGMVNGTVAMLLNGLGCWRVQVWMAFAMVAVALPLKFILAAAGPVGLVWASVAGVLVCQLGPSLVVAPRMLRRLPS